MGLDMYLENYEENISFFEKNKFNKNYSKLKDKILFSKLDNSNDSIREYISSNREKWFDEGAIN